LLDVFWFLFQESHVVFCEIEFAIVNVHMSSPWLLKGITRRDISPVLTQKNSKTPTYEYLYNKTDLLENIRDMICFG
jgi:hypothetical protein